MSQIEVLIQENSGATSSTLMSRGAASGVQSGQGRVTFTSNIFTNFIPGTMVKIGTGLYHLGRLEDQNVPQYDFNSTTTIGKNVPFVRKSDLDQIACLTMTEQKFIFEVGTKVTIFAGTVICQPQNELEVTVNNDTIVTLV